MEMTPTKSIQKQDITLKKTKHSPMYVPQALHPVNVHDSDNALSQGQVPFEDNTSMQCLPAYQCQHTVPVLQGFWVPAMTISAPSSHGDPFRGNETGCLEVSYSCSTSSNVTAKKGSTALQSTNLYGNHAIFKTKIIRTESCYVNLVEGRIGTLFCLAECCHRFVHGWWVCPDVVFRYMIWIFVKWYSACNESWNIFAAECASSWFSCLLNPFQKVTGHRVFTNHIIMLEFQRSGV